MRKSPPESSLPCLSAALTCRPPSLLHYGIEMALEPLARQSRYFVERSGLFEKVRGARHDDELLFAAEPGERCPV